jgi:probable phosphoglycerate mutase
VNRRLVLWRHGRTEWNAQQRFQGQTDIPLDEVGIEQARSAAQFLQYLTPDAIVASDLQRATATARTLADLVDLPLTTDPRLRETYAGEWEGLERPILVERYGEELLRWSADSTVRPGGGESRIEVAQRMVAGINDALEAIPEGGTLVVATHGGAARAAIAALLELPTENWGALGVMSNCSWSILREDVSPFGPRWRLVEYNAGSLPQPVLADDR